MPDGNPWSGLSAEVFLVLAGDYRREAQLRVDAPVDPARRPRRGGKRRASEGWRGVDGALLLGDSHPQFGPSDLQLRFDLAALSRIGVPELGPQFLNLNFECNRHRRHLLKCER
ncbi:hypothetical protein RHECIAT_PB0000178 (plasmid) [Rhizobium etli CIAT 652]|uniref:Uncharacterized protein n=1 Tax=Rhizobium etli (strain CIAT 652) TaxID=491916 RepID=B3Q2I4_RHIE6|nr:hypothetical protein RHECIAT_PB0000178 [Rhizobium etli CIAT 652]